jgi:tetratricopeptide (TPR) repeat protein
MSADGRTVSLGALGISRAACQVTVSTDARPAAAHDLWRTLAVSAVLLVATWSIYGQTLGHDFVNYDDNIYVYDNPTITGGVTPSSVRLAFTQSHARNWHPLTTLSHMIDCELFGLEPRGHHFTNVLLHSTVAVLLFVSLRQLTGAFWRSAFVAAIFAVHPLRVESVAWIAERKDLLSGLFFMLTLAAYGRYVRQKTAGCYLLVALALACGLMSKPMVVTLPFVLLLLDWWPLGRFSKGGRNLSLVIEKLPLMALAAAASVVTLLIQKHRGAQSDPLPFFWRLGNALTASVTYVWQTIWPTSLAPFYPHPGLQLAFWKVAAAAAVLLVLTTAAVLVRRSRPDLFAGWFWYAGMLVPVVGVVQVGAQAHADRYTYLPGIGLAICVAWGAAELSRRWRRRDVILSIASASLLGVLAIAAWFQTRHWKESEALWTHTLRVTTNNDVAHLNLGQVFYRRGQIDEALAQFEQALRVHQTTSGYDLLRAVIHTNIGSALRKKGRVDEAIAQFREAILSQPDYAEAHLNLGRALLEKNEIAEATTVLQKAVALEPEHPEMLVSLGDALLAGRRRDEAIAHYEKGLAAAPQSLVALNNLAWLLATDTNAAQRNGPRAVELARRAVEVSGGENPFYLHKLAAAYAETGDFARAIEVAEKAMQLAKVQANAGLAAELGRNLALYRANRPVRY